MSLTLTSIHSPITKMAIVAITVSDSDSAPHQTPSVTSLAGNSTMEEGLPPNIICVTNCAISCHYSGLTTT